ncbi:hypothetical protein DBQ01_05070 [Lacticaseibacillus rhamnosus]|uniref:Uncharacterized protein n=1 Tax=Lacticaseibacillus rhamnosus TaxID=47715 RepID=A0AAX0JZR7_LACRH|nr:hypothetical protein BVG98_03865 [Lacticaseibacillus rhamnosus]ONN73767.1 hypothetical protein BWR10_12775 [Lacticaseibacillus rhamnosus]PTR96771.1 hypothetical protein DBP95_05660 [Lacticaseibacillus rhamnosus]PTS01749.1 hypothetical protein DBQ01_05070 [Lacticaseibacillus rhamnosus]PTS05471.1 hypothetical protein DBQ08_05680 [Lacticaseibacillus rhamnosus]
MISDTPSWLRGGWAGTWWARLRTRKNRGFEARPWSKAEKPTPLKTNFTTEPATAPPALAFYLNFQTKRLILLLKSSRQICLCLPRTCTLYFSLNRA